MTCADQLARRFWSKVDASGDCWIWTAGKTGGYGCFAVERASVRAHRFAFELLHGEIPDGLCVLHKCDNRACVRPSHLFLGDVVDNALDAMCKGRLATGTRNGNAKLTARDVHEIRADLRKCVTIAREYGVAGPTVSVIKSRKSWGWLPDLEKRNERIEHEQRR